LKEESFRFAVKEGREGIRDAIVTYLTSKEESETVITLIRMDGKCALPGIVDISVRQGP
jgi:hypothetical protein